MQASIPNQEEFESKKDRRTILREEKRKKKKKKERLAEVQKMKEGEVLREVTVKIGLKRIDM